MSRLFGQYVGEVLSGMSSRDALVMIAAQNALKNGIARSKQQAVPTRQDTTPQSQKTSVLMNLHRVDREIGTRIPDFGRNVQQQFDRAFNEIVTQKDLNGLVRLGRELWNQRDR